MSPIDTSIHPAESNHPAGYWHSLEDGRIECTLCPRFCKLQAGQRGFCYVRRNVADAMVLTTYGRSSGFCADPIEKKPLNHFYPGTSVLSFGTAGCNLGCKFCQNWDISKSRSMDKLMNRALPNEIAQAARDSGCDSVAFTYNDPVIFAEYAMDTAQACREQGIHTVAVSAGYITEEARPDFFRYVDAANIDLKAFSDRFYEKICFAKLHPVLETLLWIRRESDIWLEITTLLIPGENDSDDELQRMSEWVARELGPDVPLHFSAFHPDFRMLDKDHTPAATLLRARKIAKQQGLNYVYVGNVHHREASSTWCPSCNKLLIERDWYQLGEYHINDVGQCAGCQTPIPGHFKGHKGNWQGQRQPIFL